MASAQDIKPPLTLEELATLFRQDVDDLPGDTVTDVNWKNDDTGLLWSNQEICRYANQAVTEFCFRNPILDHNTDITITHLTSGIDVQKISYSQKILQVHRVKYVEDATGDERVLQKRTLQWMDRNHEGWDDETEPRAAMPEYYVEDHDHRLIYLWPVPEVSGILHLSVGRLPSQSMLWSRRHQDQPEIDEQHHLCLLDYMKFLAYRKRDAETEDKDLSNRFLEDFTLMVGERPSARLLRVRRQERNHPRRAIGQYF